MFGGYKLRTQFSSLCSLNILKNGANPQSNYLPSKYLSQSLLIGHQKRHKSSHKLEIGENRQISYRLMPGQSQPTIVMVPGFHSYAHMNGMTAKSLLRYIYMGVGMIPPILGGIVPGVGI